MFKTKLVVRSILFLPIMFVAFALVYSLVHLIAPGLGVIGVVAGIAVLVWLYATYVVAPIKLFDSRGEAALRTSGFTGGPPAFYAARKRFSRGDIEHVTTYADIQWWEPHLVEYLHFLHGSGWPSQKGLVVAFDYVVPAQKTFERKRFVRNDFLHLVSTDFTLAYRDSEGKVSEHPDTYPREEKQQVLCFRASKLDRNGGYLRSRDQQMVFDLRSPVIVVGFCELERPKLSAPTSRAPGDLRPNRVKELEDQRRQARRVEQ